MSHLVAVTGATGNIGHMLAERLLRQDHRVRAIGRNSDRLAPLVALGAEPCVGDLEDARFVTESLRGVDAVFAMIPPNYTTRDLREFERRVCGTLAGGLKSAGLPRTVVLSSIGASLAAGTGPVAGLHLLEETLKAIPGLPLVILRPALFMENLLMNIPEIQSRGVMAGPLQGDLAVPMIATCDIAEVAADLLAAPTFQNQSMRELLGPRDLSCREAATIIGHAIGMPNLSYEEVGYGQFRQNLTAMSMPPLTIDAFVEMYQALNSGRIATTYRRTPQNTTPTTLEMFAQGVFVPTWQQIARRAA